MLYHSYIQCFLETMFARSWSKTKLIMLYNSLIVDANEAECPYCPSGTQCDPATNTCIKGSYTRQYCVWFHVKSFTFSAYHNCRYKRVNMYLMYIYLTYIFCKSYILDCLQSSHYWTFRTIIMHDREEREREKREISWREIFIHIYFWIDFSPSLLHLGECFSLVW